MQPHQVRRKYVEVLGNQNQVKLPAKLYQSGEKCPWVVSRGYAHKNAFRLGSVIVNVDAMPVVLPPDPDFFAPGFGFRNNLGYAVFDCGTDVTGSEPVFFIQLPPRYCGGQRPGGSSEANAREKVQVKLPSRHSSEPGNANMVVIEA